MILGVFGPRDYKGTQYDNYEHISKTLGAYAGVQSIITGGGLGVEQLATRYAEAHSIHNSVIPPNITREGTREAFIRRNKEIITQLDVALIFWDGRDPWYSKLLGTCTDNGKASHVYPL